MSLSYLSLSRSNLVVVAVLAASAAATVAAGCSSDDSTAAPPPNTDGGGQGSGDGGGVQPSPDAGGGGSLDSGGGGKTDSGGGTGGDAGGGTGGDGGGGALSCATYCASIQAVCTGNDAQYQSTQECLNACALFPVGSASDTAGNTLGCRTYHTGLAATQGGAVPHCWHAGPFGAGACGAACDDFCALTLGWCSTADGYDGGAVYASETACKTACAAYALADGGSAPQGFYASGPGGGNTLDCREYHLGNAMNGASGSAAQSTHCPHAAQASDPCK